MITLYTTHCPKCKVLEKSLQDHNIEYETITDEKVMIDKGFLSAPILEVDGTALTFPQAFNFVREYKG